MVIPDRSKYFINRYRFELPEAHTLNEASDLGGVPREDLLDMIKGLRNTVDKYEHEMQQELKEKLKQARLLNIIEMHMDCLPSSSEGHHQLLSLDHATTWLGKYGAEDGQGLILGVNSIQRAVMSRRLLELMSISQLCDARPACKHVLRARPAAMKPGNLLTFQQIALGLPMCEVLRTFPEGLNSDKELWGLTDGRLLRFAKRDPSISREAYKEMSFLTAYFHTQLSGEFQSARLSLVSSLQREAHVKKEKKECEYMPQSNFRRAVNQVRMAVNTDPKLSPTNSTYDGMTLVPPRRAKKSRLPRPSRRPDSMIKLVTAGPSAGIPMMTGAIQSSNVLRDAGDRNRERTHHRSNRTRHRNEEPPIHRAHTRHRVHRTHRQQVIPENAVSPATPRPAGSRNQVVSPLARNPHTPTPRTRTPRIRRAHPPVDEDSSQKASIITQWPRQSDHGSDKGKTSNKGKGKEVAPSITLVSPYTHSATGLPENWQQPASNHPGPSRPLSRRDNPPVRPPSSVYSVNPLKPRVPSPLPSQRHRSAHRTQTNTTPQGVGRVPAESGLSPNPRNHQQDSPQLSIPEGVDLGAVAGGLRHNHPQRPDSRASTINVDLGSMAGGLRHNHTQRQDSIASTIRVDLDSMAGGVYVAPRSNWRESQIPGPLDLDAIRAERGNNVPKTLIPTASPLPQPPLFDRRQLRVCLDDSVTNSVVSDRFDLELRPQRGRNRGPRESTKNQPAPTQRRQGGSRFREHIDTIVEVSPVINPDPSRSRSRNRNRSFGDHMQQL